MKNGKLFLKIQMKLLNKIRNIIVGTYYNICNNRIEDEKGKMIAEITYSYRLSEAEVWKNDLEKSVETFEFK